jgi:hypothetical protein
VPAGLLKSLFLDTARRGMAAAIPTDYPFAAFGLGPQPTAGAFLKALTAKCLGAGSAAAGGSSASPKSSADEAFRPSIDLILSEGSLAERILRAAPEASLYPAVYARLCECLETDSAFSAAPRTRT